MSGPYLTSHSPVAHRSPARPAWFRLIEELSARVAWLAIVVMCVSLVALLTIVLLDGPGRQIATLTEIWDLLAALR